MITISLAGLAYMFMSTTMSDVTSSAGSTVDTTTSSMLTSFKIESIDIAKVYVRNTGQNTITSLSVYVNDVPATFNVTTPIAVGSIGTVTIYSFIPDGATVKITSPNGFSASKVANPCEKASACWKFDEGSGTVAYDSSPNGNTGTLLNGPSWISGSHGSALSFDGSNDYVNITPSSSLFPSGEITIEAWIKVVNPSSAAYDGFVCRNTRSNGLQMIKTWSGGTISVESVGIGSVTSNYVLRANTWTYVVFTLNSTVARIYVNGNLDKEGAGWALPTTSMPYWIGQAAVGTTTPYLSGSVDEVRIYNRAIY
jgi:hypothetical protein